MPVKIIVAALLLAFGTSLFLPVPQNLVTSFENGQSYYAIGEYEYAITEYQKIVRFHHKAVDVNKITVEITEGLELPVRAAAFYQLGSSYKKTGRHEEAVEQYKHVLAEPGVPESFRSTVQYQIAETRFMQEAFEKAVEEYDRFISSFPQSGLVDKAYFYKGWSYYKAEKYREAISTYKELLERYPDSKYASDAQYQIADSYSKLEQYQQSIATAEEVLEKFPESAAIARAEYLKAYCYDKIGRYEEAIESYRNVIALYDKMYEILRASFREGKNIDFEEYVDLFENSFLRIGEIYRDRKHDYQKAYEAYVLAQETVKERDYKAKVQMDIGHNYRSWKKYDEARKAYGLVITNYPETPYPPEAQYHIGETYYYAGDLESARQAYLDVPAKFPDSDTELQAAAIYNAGWSSEKLGYLDEALDLYRRVAERFPRSDRAPFSLLRIGQILYEREEYEKAASSYRTLINKYSNRRTVVNQAQYYLGLTLKNLGQESEALNAFESVGKDPPRFYVAASIAVADLYYEKEQPDKAHTIINELLGRVKGDRDLEKTAHFEIAKLYRKNKEYQNSIDEYTVVIERFPEEEILNEAYFGRAASYHALGNFDQALPDYQYVLAHNPAEDLMLRTQFSIGLLYSAIGKDADAIEALRVVTEGADPELASSARLQLIALAERKNPAEAVAIYEEVLKGARDDHERTLVLTRLANVYFKLRRYDECLDAAAEVIRMNENPESVASAYYVQGNVYFERGEYAKAVNRYERITEDYPDAIVAPTALFQVGLSYQRMGTIESIDGMVDAFTRFYKSYPRNPNADAAYYYAAWGFYRKGEWAQAADVFGKLVKAFPASQFAPESRFRQGESLFNTKDYKRAMAVYDLLLQEYPESEWVGDALYSKAWALINLGRKNEAVPLFREIVEKYPNRRRGTLTLGELSQYTLGDYYYSIEKYEEAAVEYRKFMELYPNSERVPRAQFLLGQLAEINAYNLYKKGEELFDKGEYDEAISVFANVIERFPASESAVNALTNTAAAYEAKEKFEKARKIYAEIVEKYGGEPKYSAQVEFAKSHLEALKTAL